MNTHGIIKDAAVSGMTRRFHVHTGDASSYTFHHEGSGKCRGRRDGR